MARAFVCPNFQQAATITGGVLVPCRIDVIGSEVSPNGSTPLFGSFTFLDADTQPQILSKVTDMAVNASASAGLTVARSAVEIPSFVRGQ